MDSDEVDAKAARGIPLLTTYLTRKDDGSVDQVALRSLLGPDVSDDDVIQALSDMVLAAELVMMSYQVKTRIPFMEVLQEIALYRETRRGE